MYSSSSFFMEQISLKSPNFIYFPLVKTYTVKYQLSHSNNKHMSSSLSFRKKKEFEAITMDFPSLLRVQQRYLITYLKCFQFSRSLVFTITNYNIVNLLLPLVDKLVSTCLASCNCIR